MSMHRFAKLFCLSNQAFTPILLMGKLSSDIYPLLGAGTISGGTGSGNVSFKGGYFLFSGMTFSEDNYQNLSQYIYSDASWNLCMDFYIHLDGANHSLGIYAKDGTQIFSGDCKHANGSSPYLTADYKGTEYNIVASLASANDYFEKGSAHFLYYFDNEITVDQADKFFSNSIFTCRVVHNASGGGYMSDAISIEVPSGSVGSTTITQQEPIWIQMGAKSGQGMFINLVDATASGIGLSNVSVMNHASAGSAISIIDDAIAKVSEYRSAFGAQQNRLEHSKAIDDNTSENTQAAESRIRDTDMAKEMVEHSKHSILEQAGQAILAHVNQSRQGILSLLQ